MTMTRTVSFSLVLCSAFFLYGVSIAPAAAAAPNFVVIFADDLGYGDLGCFGHPTLRTPRLDRMAAEGMKLTQFYAAASVCTPSRAGLLTGRLPARSGLCSNRRRVLFPDSAGGLPESEITLAEALKEAGYATACVGKWHLGHLPEFLPTRHGFDSYYGIPYSNDMKPCPLLRDEEQLEEPVDQTTLTRRYTDEAVGFIREHADEPFFLYFAHSFPHVPLFASDEWAGRSLRGLYGDVVEELDASVGAVLDAVREAGAAENTFVVFTSDNGPWLIMDERGGSAGLLREGKGCTFEGGMREPTIVWAPDRVPAGTTNPGMGSTLDLLPTFLSLAGLDSPSDRVLDGVDLSGAWTRGEDSPRETMFFHRGYDLYAVRQGPWKAHFVTQDAYGPGSRQRTEHDTPLLYHLEHDPSEQYNVSSDHPDVIAELRALAEEHIANLNPAPSQLEHRIEK